ncbi:hypothetical protein [Salipiger sp. PrR003]|uniref:hypothetical protein n=1 Tax=Salipiger sp. PrR003 TaxID=2706776 RepID=UPI0013DB8E9C|nr:hypothetical protein [Salipiger sp. PrR003]NDV50369.1 hypothetical protein [Salipiger sp. PrR003]
MTTYTVLAYRPNGADYCKGCLMGTSDSDFEFEAFESAEEAARYAGEFLFHDQLKTELEVDCYELTFLIDGVEDHERNVEAMAEANMQERLEAHRKAEAERKKEEEAAAERKREELEKRKHAEELAKFRELKAKFEPKEGPNASDA